VVPDPPFSNVVAGRRNAVTSLSFRVLVADAAHLGKSVRPLAGGVSFLAQMSCPANSPLIEPARAVDHPRLAALLVTASMCCLVERFEEAVRYSYAGQTVIPTGSDKLPYAAEGWLGSPYLYIGQPERYVKVCRAQLARTRHQYSHQVISRSRPGGRRLP
jgi:hypothetical protein